MKKIIDDIDELFSGTLSDMHNQAVEYTNSNPARPLDSELTTSGVKTLQTSRKNSRYSIMAVAASFALIAVISVLALVVWQGSYLSGTSDDVNTAKDGIATVTSLKDTKPENTTQSTSETGPVTTQKQSDPKNVTSTTAKTPTSSGVNKPTNFEAYDHYKNAFGWYVKLRWTASTTPGVSYCYFIDPNQLNSECAYNEDFAGTSGDFSIGIGNVDQTTFYLRAIKPNGEKSEIVTVTYQMPA